MKFNIPLCLSVIAMISVFSCSKSSTSSGPTLQGVWNLTSSKGNIYVQDSEAVNHAKTITSDNYTSFTPSGQVSFTGDLFTATNIQFGVIVEQNISTYKFGSLISSSKDTVVDYQSQASSTGSFEIVGSDSLHFLTGGVPGLGGYGGALVNGAIYSLAGDSLTLTSHFYDSTGTAASYTLATGTVVSVFKK